MASPKKTSVKKAAKKKTSVRKAVAPKATAKKPVSPKKPSTRKAKDNTLAIKKGSKLACKVCGFAITVDNISGVVEEALLICCETPMHHKTSTARKS